MIIRQINGLSPIWRQIICGTNDGSLLVGAPENKFQRNLNPNTAIFNTKMNAKMSSAKWWSFCVGVDVLKWVNGQ